MTQRMTLADFTPIQQDFLLRAYWEGVLPDDPLATPKRTEKLSAAGLIHKRTSKKGRTSWRVTDFGRGIVAAHVPWFLHKRGFPSYTHQPWKAMKGEPETVDRPEAA